MATEALSEREQEALEQMREAQKQGSTLKAYAVKMGLDVGQFYELRRRLVRKVAFGALPPRKPRKSRKASVFAPVRVVPAAGVPGGTSPTCRVLHPSGWVLECDGLPPAAWIAAVLAGGVRMLRPSAQLATDTGGRIGGGIRNSLDSARFKAANAFRG